MSTRLFVLRLSKPATCPAAVLMKSCPAAISSSQETYIPLLVRHFSSPPDKTQKGTFSIDDAEMIAMFNKLMVKYNSVYNTQEEKKRRFNLFKETIEESVRHFSSLPDNAKSNKKNSVDVETMRKMFEEWMAKHRRFYDSEEEKERRFNLFMETVEENVYYFSSLAKSNENEEDSVEEDVEMKKMFEDWMSKFKRCYTSPQEKEMRFKAFKENVRKINAHNKVEGRTYDKGVNMFADWTSEDFKNFNPGRRHTYHVERVPGKNQFADRTCKELMNYNPGCLHTCIPCGACSRQELSHCSV